jgi:hypothetical protein
MIAVHYFKPLTLFHIGLFTCAVESSMFLAVQFEKRVRETCFYRVVVMAEVGSLHLVAGLLSVCFA